MRHGETDFFCDPDRPPVAEITESRTGNPDWPYRVRIGERGMSPQVTINTNLNGLYALNDSLTESILKVTGG